MRCVDCGKKIDESLTGKGDRCWEHHFEQDLKRAEKTLIKRFEKKHGVPFTRRRRYSD